MRLSRKQIRAITSGISDVFARMRARLTGSAFPGSTLTFSVTTPDPMDSLESVYRHAGSMLYGPSFRPDRDQVKDLAEVTANYLEAERLRTINKVIKGIEGAASKRDAVKVVSDAMNRASGYVSMLSETEARTAQAYAERDGISRLASSMGIDDPQVAFLGKFDDRTCQYCLAMYHMPGNPQVPRVHKLSQVRQGYFRAKDWDGSEVVSAPLHPRCRHVMTFVPPGYGFDSSGAIKFVGLGYDAYEAQRKQLGKSESIMFLPTCDCSSHPESPAEPNT